MDLGGALIFSAYMLPVTLLDNFLRPFVMAHGLKTPMLIILVGAGLVTGLLFRDRPRRVAEVLETGLHSRH